MRGQNTALILNIMSVFTNGGVKKLLIVSKILNLGRIYQGTLLEAFIENLITV
jgi:hypothetical protein